MIHVGISTKKLLQSPVYKKKNMGKAALMRDINCLQRYNLVTKTLDPAGTRQHPTYIVSRIDTNTLSPTLKAVAQSHLRLIGYQPAPGQQNCICILL